MKKKCLDTEFSCQSFNIIFNICVSHVRIGNLNYKNSIVEENFPTYNIKFCRGNKQYVTLIFRIFRRTTEIYLVQN